MTPTLSICQLYPADMNMYGDWGNVLTLARRAEAQGLNVEIREHNIGDATDFASVDLIVGGGGQDSAQLKAHADLVKQATALKQLAEAGLPMLVVHGMYQLFGKQVETTSGEIVQGIGIFDAVTTLAKERLLGNITVDTPDFGKLIGYENHLGSTTLSGGTMPLGTCPKGMGNNETDGTEGARAFNVIGTYLHGALLPKNPVLADFLIDTAIQRKEPSWATEVAEDPALVELTEKARKVAASRPR